MTSDKEMTCSNKSEYIIDKGPVAMSLNGLGDYISLADPGSTFACGDCHRKVPLDMACIHPRSLVKICPGCLGRRTASEAMDRQLSASLSGLSSGQVLMRGNVASRMFEACVDVTEKMLDKPVMKDSGERQQFEGGAQRDTASGKPPYSLLGPYVWTTLPFGHHIRDFLLRRDPLSLDVMLEEMLREFGHDRLALWLEQGSKKYSPWNWLRGMPLSRVLDSLGRHLAAYAADKKGEDHAAAALCNVQFLQHYFYMIGSCRLDPKWNDLPDFNLYKPERPDEQQ